MGTGRGGGAGRGDGQVTERTGSSGPGEGGATAPAAVHEARRLLRCARSGALASLHPATGSPFASLVTVATDHAGSPVLLLSDLAVHSANIAADPRVSLLVGDSAPGDPLRAARLSLVGALAPVPDDQAAIVRRRFLSRHADAALYCDFGDFRFHSMTVGAAHLVAGFGRIVDLAGADLVLGCEGCDALVAAEAGALDHLNADHGDVLALLATRLAGAPSGDWRACGLDPEGLDLIAGERTCRVVFPRRVREPGALRATLRQMAEDARSG